MALLLLCHLCYYVGAGRPEGWMLVAGSCSDCGFPETSHQSQPEFCIKQQLAMHDTSASPHCTRCGQEGREERGVGGEGSILTATSALSRFQVEVARRRLDLGFSFFWGRLDGLLCLSNEDVRGKGWQEVECSWPGGAAPRCYPDLRQNGSGVYSSGRVREFHFNFCDGFMLLP